MWILVSTAAGTLLCHSNNIMKGGNPGFPRQGVPTQKVGELTYYFGYFFQQLHEIEKSKPR